MRVIRTYRRDCVGPPPSARSLRSCLRHVASQNGWGEGQGEGPGKYAEFPLTLTLSPRISRRKAYGCTMLAPLSSGGEGTNEDRLQ